jgi:hypothetical protein
MLPEFDGPNGHMFNFPDLVAARAAARKAKRTKKAAPPPNGDNGPPEPPPMAPKPGRTADGKFAAGNPGGPGNPFARQVASFRQALYEAVTRDMLKDLATRLWGMALGGNVAAARLLLQYLVGKPQDPPNPDRLEHDEWQVYQSEAVPPADMSRLLGSMPATMANGWADGIWPVMADCNIRRPMLDRLRADREQREAQAHAAEAKQANHPAQDAPTTNGDNGRHAAPHAPAAEPTAPGHAPDAPTPATAVTPEPTPDAAPTPHPGRQQTAPPATARQSGRPERAARAARRREPGRAADAAAGHPPTGGSAGAPSTNGPHGTDGPRAEPRPAGPGAAHQQPPGNPSSGPARPRQGSGFDDGLG